MPICSASACGSCRRLTVDSLRMPLAEGLLGKPCAGNLHARFEEGGGGGSNRPSATRLCFVVNYPTVNLPQGRIRAHRPLPPSGFCLFFVSFVCFVVNYPTVNRFIPRSNTSASSSNPF